MGAGYLLKAMALGFSAAVMPGALQAYLINQVVTRGWRRCVVLSLAPLVSDIPIVILVVLVLAFIPDWALSAIQMVGGAFILYLACRSLQRLVKPPSEEDKSPAYGLWSAIAINLLNPNVYLYWGTISGPLFIEGWRTAHLTGILFLASFYSVMILVTNFIMLAVDRLSSISSRIQRILQYLSVIFMALMGILQIISGLNRWSG